MVALFRCGRAGACLVAEDNGSLVGLVHYIFHRNTWMVGDVCYLEDLFTAPHARGQGVGRALIEAVYDKARQAGSSRVYWMTQESNAQAMLLYDKVANKPGFLQYRGPGDSTVQLKSFLFFQKKNLY